MSSITQIYFEKIKILRISVGNEYKYIIKPTSYPILARWHKYEYLIAKDRALTPQIFLLFLGEGDICIYAN